VITPHAEEVIKSALRELHAHADDDHSEMAEKVRAVAWILPALRTAADVARTDQLGGLQELLQQLVTLSQTLSPQRGLEASLAQGFKLDAVHHPDRTVDPLAVGMLTDPESKASFWFSRVLALQAVARRSITADVAQKRDALEIIRPAQRDPHPFVRKTAALCRKAVASSNWTRYQWDDITEVAARTPRGLVVEATQLIGDMVLALNLNEGGSPSARAKFGHSNKLPACLSKSRDRLEIIGAEAPHPGCPFADGSKTCFCPYLYEQPDHTIRRELSRAFCRHQRLTARPLRWHWRISVKSLKAFWAELEDLARF
jgi:hypothetical protein